MKISRFLLLTFLASLANVAVAQNDPEAPDGDITVPADNNGAVQGASRVLQVNQANLANLPALLGRGPGAISLGVSEEAFDADAGAQQSLLSWVRGGGTVFLHTGAARAFGFQTVEARSGTNAVAGQLYGRARAALPFGAHPLLWDDGKGRGRRAPGTDPTQFPGVGVVFYELREGDHLVQSHPAGTPLLEASDLAGGTGGALYAAAIAPFGRGFAVFTPDSIDQTRGDGALFARNLLGLLSPAANSRVGTIASAAANARLVGIPASAIENGGADAASLQRALATAGTFSNASLALPAFGTTPKNAPLAAPGDAPMTPAMGAPETQDGANETVPPDEAPAGEVAATDGAVTNGAATNDGATNDPPLDQARAEAVVLLTRAEANSYAQLIAAGGNRAGAAINLLRARLFLGRGDTQNASRALQASEALAPNSAELALWRGIMQVGAAQNLNQPSPVRAQLVDGAARDLAQAAGGASLLAGERTTGGGNPTGGATLAGIPLTALRSWSAKLALIAQVFALEPPLVEQYGTGSGAITVRAVAEDTSLRLIVPGAQVLANARNFGWHGDNEEILLFPTPESYLVYRRALGLTSPTVPLPAGAVGDVVGQRICMIALPSTPAVRRNPTTGQVTVLANRNSAANVLARLHSYVLLGAYDEGARSPIWLQLGLENLINIAVVGDTEVIANNQTLEQTVQTGGLLTPQQFSTGLANARPDQITIAQAQAASLMAFFYRAYGAGAVTETIQRLGAGQNIDDALGATTEGDEVTLFRNWRETQFGPRTFPNLG